METPPPASPGPPPDQAVSTLHDPARRMDVAFTTLRNVPPGSYATCLGPAGAEPSPILVERLGPTCRWVTIEDHPLTYVDPDHHLLVHQAWLRACHGPLRVAQVTIRAVHPFADGIEPGWYEATLIDLVGIEGVGTVVLVLHEADGPIDAEQTELEARSWFHGTSSFRLRLDVDGRILTATHNLEDVLGRPLDTVLGTPVLDLAHPEDRAAAVAQWRRLAADDGPLAPIRLRLHRADGTWWWAEITSWTLLDERGARTVISDVRDVQAQVEAEQAEEATRRAHDRLARVLDEIDHVVMVGQLGVGLLYTNTAAKELLGGDLTGNDLFEVMTPELLGVMEDEILPRLDVLESWTGEVRVPRSIGDRTMELTISPVAEGDGDVVSWGLIMRDITEDRARQAELAAQARCDHLTDLPNRLALTEHLDRVAASGGPGSSPADLVAVSFIDLDNLKIVNDGLGHSAGDQLLVEVGARLAAGSPGLVARFGGDEFVVVADVLGGRRLDDAAVDRLAAALLDQVASVRVPGSNARVTASIGVAVHPRADLDAESAIRDADAAMYVAKRRGRAQVARFDDTMRQAVTRRFVLEASLHLALDEGSLWLAHQPVIDLDGGAVTGFEALARWELATPDEFIRVAEESSLILPLGAWAVCTAAADLARVQAAVGADAALRMAVNVSGHQLLDPRFPQVVLDAAEAAGVAPDRLVLELTESVLIDPREDIDVTLRTLRDHGVSLALDDFGSGYSSLGYLRRYPIDILKLDTTYTQRLLDDPDTRIIADAVVTMANRLGLEVVAEGVETEAQRDVVRELGITRAQGYLFGRPLPIDEVIAGMGPMLQA